MEKFLQVVTVKHHQSLVDYFYRSVQNHLREYIYSLVTTYTVYVQAKYVHTVQ